GQRRREELERGELDATRSGRLVLETDVVDVREVRAGAVVWHEVGEAEQMGSGTHDAVPVERCEAAPEGRMLRVGRGRDAHEQRARAGQARDPGPEGGVDAPRQVEIEVAIAVRSPAQVCEALARAGLRVREPASADRHRNRNGARRVTYREASLPT